LIHADGDGSLDAREFVILILVRIGALNPELIKVINDRFRDFDTEGKGFVSYAALKSSRVGVDTARDMVHSNIQGSRRPTMRLLGFGTAKIGTLHS